MKKLFLLVAAVALTACVPDGGTPERPAAKSGFLRSASAGQQAFVRVSQRVEPVAERVCRSIHPTAPRTFCDFRVTTINDPRQPPNAFQTIGRDGRPVIAFNINMLRTVRNDHEIAFIFGHEAGHQIARHIEQTQKNALAGALIGGILIAAGGGDASVGVDLGAQIGGRSYSKKFELEADAIAAHVTSRAGYSPEIGSRTFERTVGSRALLSTHPPSTDRQARVDREIARINAARAQGRVAPIVW